MTTMTIQQTLESAAEHHRAGRLADAQSLYRQVLAQEPRHPDALRLLGVVSFLLGQKIAALELLERAVAADPNIPASHSDLGLVLAEMGRIPDAIVAYQTALFLRPDLPETLYNLGNAQHAMGRLDESVEAFTLSLEYRPGNADTYFQLGNALRDKGLWKETLGAYHKALELRPNSAGIYFSLGSVLESLGQIDLAEQAYSDALDLEPDFFQARNNLGQILKAKGQLKEAVACFERAVAVRPGNAAADSNRVYAMHYLLDDPAALLDANLAWDERHGRPLEQFRKPHTKDPSPDRRLRIGYVSPSFCNHVTGRNLLPLWREHDRGEFEIFFYSDVARPDRWTDRFRSLAGNWREIAGRSDEDFAELIARDQIDILVDTAMHMAGNRLVAFARKPAPLQITFGGYPSGTGLAAMDYRISDPYLDPPGESDRFYVEKSLHLPASYWCYDAEGMELSQSPEVGPQPAAVLNRITFGCLNNFCKVSDAALALWARVLDATPGSRLLLLAPPGVARQRVLKFLGDRVDFVESQPRREYLLTYQRIDLGLDTIPYNGHTTSLDSLWMGVPVVTLIGKTAVGRAGFSQLSNLGLSDLAAESPDQFVKIAASLVGDLPRLRRLRWTLRQKMRASPLTDAGKFTRSIEAAYRSVWRQWCESAKIQITVRD